MKEKEVGRNKKCSAWGWRSFTVAFCLLVFAQPFGLSSAELTISDDIVKKFFKDNPGVTYDQLEQYMLDKVKDLLHPLGNPRLFSLCLTSNQILDRKRVKEESNANYFQRIIDAIELDNKRSQHFQADKNKYFQPLNKSFIESVTLTRIRTPEADMVNMRQWVHITVKTIKTLKALYLQTIGGPFGLPFGEFSLDFPCSDFSRSQQAVGQLEHCAYRPRSSIVHPNVYVGYDQHGRDEWHVHLKYFDIACMSSPYFQLIMIAGNSSREDWVQSKPKEGKDFVVQLSQVFESPKPDTVDGAPYPYYPKWEKSMSCHDTTPTASPSSRVGGDSAYEAIKWKATDKIQQIKASEEYDYCIMANTTEQLSKVNRDEVRYECNPGPFKCDESLYLNQTTTIITQLNDIFNVTEREIVVYVASNTTENCTACLLPPCEKTDKSKKECRTDQLPDLTSLEEAEVLDGLDLTTRGKNHGSTVMVAFLFFIPLANYIARFCKDMGGKWVFGNGPWIFLHCAFSLMAIAICVDSAGNVVANFGDHKDQQIHCLKLNHSKGTKEYDECMKPVAFNTPHNWLGTFSIFLLVLSLCTGFVRPSSTKLRKIIDMLHSHIGYFTWIMGIVATFVAVQESHCPGGLIVTSMAIGIPVIFSAFAVLLDIMEDKQLKIIPGRRQWPVYEQVELEKRGPCDLIKWILFGVYAFCMFVILAIIVANTTIIEQSGDEEFKKISTHASDNNALTKIQGMFGECKPINTKAKRYGLNED